MAKRMKQTLAARTKRAQKEVRRLPACLLALCQLTAQPLRRRRCLVRRRSRRSRGWQQKQLAARRAVVMVGGVELSYRGVHKENPWEIFDGIFCIDEVKL